MFTVEDGKITYDSGKGEKRSIPLSDVLSVDSTNADRLEFSLKIKQGREYAFRVETSAAFSYWVRGLQSHAQFYRNALEQRASSGDPRGESAEELSQGQAAFSSTN